MPYLPTENPPELFRQMDDVRESHQNSSHVWSEWDSWIRQTDVVLDNAKLRESPVKIRNEDAVIDIGQL